MMMTILDRAAGALRPHPDVRPATPTAATLAALQAAAGSFLVVVLPVVVGWLAAGPDRAPWTGVLRAGAVGWLLGNHAPVAVPGGRLTFAPLGLLAVCAACLVVAAARMARMLDPLAERIEAGATRAAPSWPGLPALATFTGAYAALAALLAAAARSGDLRPDPVRAAVAAAALAAVCGLLGAAGYVCGGPVAVAGRLVGRLPAVVRPAVRPAVAALAVQAAAGALLVAVSLVVERGAVLSLHRELAPGAAGGAVLTLAQVAVLPNLVVWACAFLAGPGFAVGAGTSVSPAAVALGDLPLVPVLGALPSPGPMPGAAFLLVAVPFVAGGAAGVLVVRRHGGESGRWPALLDTLVAGLLAGAVAGVVAWAAGGAAGPGRLAVTGPSPLLTGIAFAGEVAIGALVVAGARAALPRFSLPRG